MSGRLRSVDEFLLRLGLHLRPEWLESCAAGLPGFDGLGRAEVQARRCFEQFLFADMNTCGAGVLPEGVGNMHAVVLDGPFVLQVDEIVNISAPLRERYHEIHAGPKRCLKLSMTDGIQRIFGMEYRPIKDLEVLAPAGLKIVIRNVHIRRGLLMLVPEVIEILGGVVDDLEAARDRLVSEVNKPPRGKRKQGGLPLSSRATLAAWPGSSNVTNGGEGIPLAAAVNSSHSTGLGNVSQFGRTGTLTAEHVSRPVMANIVQQQSRRVHEINMQDLSTSRNNTGTSAFIPNGHDGTQTSREEYVDPSVMVNNTHEQQHVQEVTMREQATAFSRIERSSTSTPSNHGSHAIGGTGANDVEATRSSSWRVQEFNRQDLSTLRNNTGTSASTPNGHDRTHTIREKYVDPSNIANNCHEQLQGAQDVTMQEQATVFVRTERTPSTATTCEYDSNHLSHAVGGTGANDVEAAQTSILDEINHMEESIILSGENEKPFTYIISMIADWVTRQETEPYIQGKIKGFITSVKSFQYRGRTEYELYVYIDDGSYISMAHVDHNIVKNMIGLCPEEVVSVLSGESTLVSTSDMKETLRGFQKFWVKFEGMMLIEFNKNSSLPIVRGESKGCVPSNVLV
ncbi:hypothetical protein QOZ80_4AG0320010 [Eleusine coracana subsp. coracana]|nr:hypothetical protein QOZ80_4AG0320010 [Eleusine coracana subsp. coracana]